MTKPLATLPVATEVKVAPLPAVAGFTGPMLKALTDHLGVERAVLAGDDQIAHAWLNLPRLLSRIPPEQRTDTLVRMCVAVATGLFDSAINYAWNAAVTELREKVRRFGLTVIVQVIAKPFDEAALLDLKDAELLNLCLKLNLVSEEGFFLLDQCRAIRNNFSAAHPAMGVLDEDEFLAFLNRCAKYALGSESNPRGVDIPAFMAAIKPTKFSDVQLETWRSRLSATFEAQRDALLGMLHGIYCDPGSGEEARVNSLAICHAFKDVFTPRCKSALIDRHQDYRAKGDEPRVKASQQYFERLGLLALLGESELHSLISAASANLMSVHNGMNNFYNEPPFAERLAGLTSQNRVPETAQFEFVETVVACSVGNGYGVSNAAVPSYWKMVRSFSPAEIRIMLALPEGTSIVARRMQIGQCKANFAKLVGMIDASSVPTPSRKSYEQWLKAA